MPEKLVYDIFNTPHLKNVLVEVNRKVKSGKRYVAKFEEVTKRKSLKQLAHLFGNLITPLAEYLSAEYGISIDVLSLERELINRFNAWTESPVLAYSFDFELMQPQVVPVRLSRMNLEQAGAFINWCVEYVRERFPDLNLPPYVDYLWMNKVNEEKIKQVVYESKRWPERDKSYLVDIRLKPCIICGAGNRPCEAHHLRDMALGAGVAEKVADYYTVPLCRDCHQALHDKGVKEIEGLIAPVLHGRGMEVFCKLCYYRWREHL